MGEECSAHNDGGNNSAGFDRVVAWTEGGAAAGAVLGLLYAASIGLSWWGGLIIIGIVAVGGAGMGLFIGQAAAWFSRLKTQTPDTITILASVKCAGKNPWGLQPWTDGDWTCNMGDLALAAPSDLQVTAPGATTQVDEVRLRAAPGSGLAHAFPTFNEDEHHTPVLHCEISSHVGSYAVVGGAIGTVAGAVAGALIGAAICVALALVTFGIGGLLCAICVAVGFALGAWGGGALGDLAGAAIGAIADAVSDFDHLGKTIEDNRGCFIFISGTWVTDISHEHNEIHDIEAVTIAECGVGSAASGLQIAGAVGIGRHPSDIDP
jgi:hypothetical protein